MSGALVSIVLTQLGTILEQQIRREVRLVVGVKKDVQKLTSTLEAIQAVLVDADKRQIKEEAVKLWLEKLKDVAYDTDDVLNEWSTAILTLQIEESSSTPAKKKKKKNTFFFFISPSCFPLNPVVRRRDIALKIKGINERLDVIDIEKNRYKFNESKVEEPERIRSTSLVNVSEVRGRDDDKKTLVSKLCERGLLQIISIVGLGGIGKTTLAQLAYHSDEVKRCFNTRIWVCVSDPFDEVRVAKAIVEAVNLNAPHVFEPEAALQLVINCIEGTKFLLVLDDVWTEDYRKWEPLFIALKNGAFGSKILVTTRSERVSKMMGTAYTHCLGQLSDQDCWYLFSQIAFTGKSHAEFEELEGTGRKISDKCKGLPLAAKTIGSLMRLKNTLQDWEGVLDSEIWELEQAEKGIFPPLLLSYYELSSAVKRCFSYCANFPKDYKIEADNLIKIWMAQGYLTTKENAEMEETGQEYLDDLIMRFFFQDLEKDKGGDSIIRFKMHDMVHDLAQFLTKNECAIMEADSERRMHSTGKKFRHLTLIREEDAPFPVPAAKTERLHTFWVQSFYDSPPIVSEIDNAPADLFHRLTFVKVLDLSRNRLSALPKEVGKLMNLRYLNLSHNPLWELPDTVCDLCNLQTLKLFACVHLRKLPQRMEKLTKLRHLEIDSTDDLRTLPKGIGKLSSLRTLSKFVIGRGGDTKGAACKLGDLELLDNLRGCFKMEGLGYVADAREAAKAGLKNKKDIIDLHMDFSLLVPAEGTTAVFEALQLHKNLQCLQIKLYGGTRFPNWMISLTSLRELRLQECQNCTCLPPLGKLPSLETLNIESMHNLKCVGREFLGVEMDKSDDSTTKTNYGTGGSSSSSSSSSSSFSSITAFPKLKKLKIVYMRSWEQWDVTSREGIEQDGIIRIMPCLRYLKISHCDKLKTLPDPLLQLTPLKKLRVHNCPILQQRYQKRIGEDWVKISHIPKSRIS